MNTFTKYHLAITKEQQRPKKISSEEKLNIAEIKPDYEIFSQLIARVGGPWGWTRRPHYLAGNRMAIEQRLKKSRTRLFLLRRQDRIIGYCLATPPEFDGNEAHRLGLPKEPGIFRNKIIEIENFGLFPEHTGKGHGQYFFGALLEKLFVDSETIYLSTRSSNHAQVVPFYESFGMRVLHKETLPDDLVTILPAATAEDEARAIF